MAAPRTSRFLRWGFRRYLLGGLPFGRGMLARYFHAVRLLDPVPDELQDGGPAGKRVFFLNHPGWWDPLAAAALSDHLAPGRVPVAPVDAAVLRAAPLLGWLGLFGVERDTAAGAKAFLTAAAAVLDDPAADLWLTPEGTFAAPDARPLRFAPGLGHLLARDPDLTAVPVAVRYDFWEDRRPELLLAVGEPVRRADVRAGEGEEGEDEGRGGDGTGAGAPRRSAAPGASPVRGGECSRFLAGRLSGTLDRLSEASAARDPRRFRTIGRARRPTP